jgi:hypothetical protein
MKACPWRLGNSRHTSVGEAQCLKSDCLAWDEQHIGCKLIEKEKYNEDLDRTDLGFDTGCRRVL